MKDDNDRRQENATILNDQMMQAWSIYIKFHTVFLTFNATALGVVVSLTQVSAARALVCLAFAAMNVVAFVTGMAMRGYTKKTVERFCEMKASYLAHFGELGRWAGLGNAIAHVVIGLLWLVVALFPLHLPTT